MVMVSNALNAKQAGDMETYFCLMRIVPIPAEILLFLKQCGNADFIRPEGLNTSLADAKFGLGWLNRENE